jgi:hypothetical protein
MLVWRTEDLVILICINPSFLQYRRYPDVNEQIRSLNFLSSKTC